MKNIYFYSFNFVSLIILIIFLFLYFTQDTNKINYVPGTQKIDPLTGLPKIDKKNNNYFYFLISSIVIFIISIIMTVVNINSESKKPDSTSQDTEHDI
jgi:hypothetical protein